MLINCCPAPWSKRAEIASLLTIAVVVLCILSPIAARAQTETVIYNFTYPTFSITGCPPESANTGPNAGLLVHGGHLLGTTPEGGHGEKGVPDTKAGMVFGLASPASGTLWKESILHSFINEPEPLDGTYPCSRLIQKNGVLYGSTIGSNAVFGFGTVYSMTPPPAGKTAWTETLLYSFSEESGGEPYDGLAAGNNGSLYGVGYFGANGSNGGIVFQLNPPTGDSGWTEVTILSNNDGTLYNGDLLLDSSTGSLFGTTQDGGAHGYGNVFELTPSGDTWTYSDLYDFTGGSDGASPNGGLAGRAGDLFGTTRGGGDGTGSDGSGVLFELRQEIAGDPLYTLIVQHTFAGGAGADGAIPFAGLYEDASGTLWGTTEYGGPFRLHFATYGTIFKLYPDRTIVNDWHYASVYAFAGQPDGAYPESLLTEDTKGNLYGTTNAGGTANTGAVFQFTP
jgi:uncharacterized repeat protein (TIGR03803 family)